MFLGAAVVPLVGPPFRSEMDLKLNLEGGEKLMNLLYICSVAVVILQHLSNTSKTIKYLVHGWFMAFVQGTKNYYVIYFNFSKVLRTRPPPPPPLPLPLP